MVKRKQIKTSLDLMQVWLHNAVPYELYSIVTTEVYSLQTIKNELANRLGVMHTN